LRPHTIDRDAPLVLLSCYQAVDVSRLASPTKFFAEVRSGKIAKCITRADRVPVSRSRYAASLVMAGAPETIYAIIRCHLTSGPAPIGRENVWYRGQRTVSRHRKIDEIDPELTS
jgi:hypothetical protein